MSPPAMMFQEPVSPTVSKVAAVPHTTAVPVKGQTKPETIEAMAGAWENFKFAPIRESQIAREMGRRYFADLDKVSLDSNWPCR